MHNFLWYRTRVDAQSCEWHVILLAQEKGVQLKSLKEKLEEKSKDFVSGLFGEGGKIVSERVAMIDKIFLPYKLIL